MSEVVDRLLGRIAAKQPDYSNMPIIIGFGHRARHGKDTVAATIQKHRGNRYHIITSAFAAALKREVLEAFQIGNIDYWKFEDGEINRKGPSLGPLASFFNRVRYSEQCWLWLGKVGDDGYGVVYTPEREYKAHRFMWEKVLGIEPVQLLRHRCDNRLCVNPTHLISGTLQENCQDMVDRVRFVHGESHPNATLTDKEVEHVLDLLLYWDMTQAEICRIFNVSSATVSRIANGKTRKRFQPKTEILSNFSDVWLNDENKPKFRRMLQRWGTEYRRSINPDYWVQRNAEFLANSGAEVGLIPDLRFPNEFTFCQKYGAAVKVYRPGVSSPNSHPSEESLAHVKDYEWNRVVINEGTLEDLEKQALYVFDEIMEKTQK